jgi:hypothetical protein
MNLERRIVGIGVGMWLYKMAELIMWKRIMRD